MNACLFEMHAFFHLKLLKGACHNTWIIEGTGFSFSIFCQPNLDAFAAFVDTERLLA